MRAIVRCATVIREPTRDELPQLREIERDAGAMFAAVGMPEVAAHEPLPLAELERYRAAGHAWVAADGGQPVAYLVSSVVDGCAFVEQVTVAPSHARRGLGRTLLDNLAATSGRGLLLTTFRDVPWNAPYYARLGFSVLEQEEYGPELAALVQRESAAIPTDAPRVAMSRRALGS
jgi:GNAT superfamily N-acetyltransferase